ncbi:MAG: acyl-CoA dehydrogenase family protein [Acidimicrobiia bacterium]
MDLELSEDQEFFRDTTHKFLWAGAPIQTVRSLIDDPTGFDRAAWAQGAELGWFSMLVPEESGGGSVSGEGVCDLAIVMEELGRAVFPGPVLPTNLAAFAIARSGTAEQKDAYLGSIVAGETIGTWAFAEANDAWNGDGVTLSATADGDGFVLNGVKRPVQDAHVADIAVVTARTGGGLTQFIVPSGTAGVTLKPLKALDLARRFSEMRFDGVRLPASAVLGTVDGAGDDANAQRNVAIALQCAESVGVIDRCYEFTLEYMFARKAFGRPIGSFQALKHRLADMLLWLESAKAISVVASKAVQHGVDADENASLAQAYIGDRGPVIVRECLQLHGGIGYTWEHDLHFYMRRVESNAAMYGAPRQHLSRLADLVGV